MLRDIRDSAMAETSHYDTRRRSSELTVVLPSQASHAAYSTADSKTFCLLARFQKPCLNSTFFPLLRLFNLFVGGVATYGSTSQSRSGYISDVAWYTRAFWNIKPLPLGLRHRDRVLYIPYYTAYHAISITYQT